MMSTRSGSAALVRSFMLSHMLKLLMHAPSARQKFLLWAVKDTAAL
jgi:hypothetical protein